VTFLDVLHSVVTNPYPRRSWTRFMGWFSQIEHPIVRDVSLGIWKRCADLQLHEAQQRDFRSLHDCFTRALRPDARPIDSDPAVLISPCDGIVGGAGKVQDGQLIQAKGVMYALEELLVDPELAALYRDGCYVTLRLTASMYHRFHAPHDCQIEHVTYVAGDVWNTHPRTLARVPRLYCQNERAVLRVRLRSGAPIALVPVAAILVASIRLHCLDVLLHLDHPGPNEFAVSAAAHKGDELGWFQHGSTILVFAPPGFELCEQISAGARVRMGQALLRNARA
jgi:phosphatidylserine decarboxylase